MITGPARHMIRLQLLNGPNTEVTTNLALVKSEMPLNVAAPNPASPLNVAPLNQASPANVTLQKLAGSKDLASSKHRARTYRARYPTCEGG
jgi:hypothetical protein